MSMRHVLFGAGLVALVGAPATAQEVGYVAGFGGATATVINSPVFGGGIGFDVGPSIQVTGELGRMQDVMPNFTRDDLRLAEREFRSEGIDVAFTTRVPTFYAIGGIRALVGTFATVQPFVSADAGVAHLMPKPKFVVEGTDFTSAMLEEPTLRRIFDSKNRPIVAVGGGISVRAARHVVVDVGYKFSRIFIRETTIQSPDSPHQHDGINVHRMTFGVGYRF